MYQIAIFDDEPRALQEISRMTDEILTELCIPHRITCYGDVERLYRALSAGKEQIHLLLLDIVVTGKSAQGLALAQRLRENENEVSIILFSQSADFILNGYDVQASGYLLKPVQREKLGEKLEYDYRRRHQKRFLLTGDASWEGLPLKGILYLETAGRHMNVHSVGGRTDVYPGRVRDALARLPEDVFCQCHQSFIINLDNTRKVERYNAWMLDGARVSVSKSYYKTVQERFLRSLEKR